MTSRTFKIIVNLTTLLVAVGCGIDKKNPMEPYKDLQVVPETQLNGMSNDKTQYIVIENNKNVLTQVSDKDPRATDGAGQVALQNGVYQVSAPENISFTEEKAGKFEFSVKFLRGKVKFDIEPSDLPDASFKVEKVDQDVNLSKYKVSWTPIKGTIAADKFSIIDSFKISLKDVEYVSPDTKVNDETKAVLESLMLKTTDIAYVVRKDDQIPTIKVNGLDKNLTVGEITKFSVDITAPSSYTSPEPLGPEVFFDLVNIVNSKGLVEANGAYFVSVDPEKNKMEKLGNNKWRIHYIFDTKNVAMLPQFDKNLKVVENSDKLYVSLSFRLSSDKVAVSDKKTVRFYISLK